MLCEDACSLGRQPSLEKVVKISVPTLILLRTFYALLNTTSGTDTETVSRR